MGAIQLLRKLKALNQQLVQLIEDALIEIEPYLIQLNKDKLAEGEDSMGNSLGIYKETTHLIKESKGRPALSGNISLHDTGDFWAAINIDIFGNSLLMYSSDWKESMLIKEYGKYIIGIPLDKKEEVPKKLYAVLMPQIMNTLQNA